MTYTLGFSPCPNDTFIFDALVNGRIDTEGLAFDVQLEDVQTLNQWALQGRLDISKISYGVLPHLLDQYTVLNSGGALGKGVGPLLISRTEPPAGEEAIQALVNTAQILLPGAHTTAHFLFARAFPGATSKQFVRFDEIENRVLSAPADGPATLGVIIHENRFTYREKGLFKIRDLGNYWEESTGNPIPLGGIVVRNTIDPEVQARLDRLIRQSITYAFDHYPQLAGYVREHSQEMQETVMRQHIDLYVNHYSLNLGNEGRQAVQHLLETYEQLHGLPPASRETIFVKTAESVTG